MTWQPYREPLTTTLLRTGTIALAAGAALAASRGGLARWPTATLLALWPALGGHYVELFFLNHIRPRLGDGRLAHAAVRVTVWFAAARVSSTAGGSWNVTLVRPACQAPGTHWRGDGL